jgi:hypothetical protein
VLTGGRERPYFDPKPPLAAWIHPYFTGHIYTLACEAASPGGC